MAKFKDVVITKLGLALITATQSGGTIEFTGLKIGNGIYDGTEVLEDRTALKNVQKTFGISGITRQDSVVKIRSVVSNEGVTEGYYITEIGLFAKDSTGSEMLYAIFIAETDRADYFPPYEDFPQNMTLEIYITAVGVAEGVTFTASIVEGVYATVEDLEDFRVEVDALKKSVSDGKTLVAGAITNKGVNTATDATFATMAGNIAAIKTNPTLQAKTATLSTAAQTIKADSGYDGLSQVTVPAIGGTATVGNVLSGRTFSSGSGINQTGTMADNGAVTQNLNAGGSYTIPAGFHNGSGKVNANSLASQTQGTATAAQILSPQTAFVNGSKITGTMVNRNNWSYAVDLRNSGSSLDIVPQPGYYSGAAPSYTTLAYETIASSLGITAPKIVTGNTICGVAGTGGNKGYSTGVCNSSNSVVASNSYYTNSYSVDSTSYSSIMQDIVIVTHGLPFIPRLVRLKWISPNNNNEYVSFLERGCEIGYIRINNDFSLGASYRILDYTTKVLIRIPSLVTDTVFYFMPMAYGSLANVTWEAWE